MNRVLVDTSVWIDYFAGKKTAEKLDLLLNNLLVCTNKIILCELVPFLITRKEIILADSLFALPENPMNIDWDRLISFQTSILRNDCKRIGIPDLMIIDNVIQNDLELFTLDKPVIQLKGLLKFRIFQPF